MDTDTHPGRTCEDAGRDEVMLPQAKECPGLLANHQKIGGRQGTHSSLSTLRRNQPHGHLDPGPIASRTVRQYIPVISATWFVVPQERNRPPNIFCQRSDLFLSAHGYKSVTI